MSTRTSRAILSVLIVGAALGALLFTTMAESASFYKEVHEVMPNPEAWYGKNLALIKMFVKEHPKVSRDLSYVWTKFNPLREYYDREVKPSVRKPFSRSPKRGSPVNVSRRSPLRRAAGWRRPK